MLTWNSIRRSLHVGPIRAAFVLFHHSKLLDRQCTRTAKFKALFQFDLIRVETAKTIAKP